MTVRVGLGLSEEASAFAAGRAATRDAQANGGATEARLVIVLATPRYDHAQVIEGVRSLTQNAPLIGGSTPCLFTSRGLCMQGAAVLLLGGDGVTCAVDSRPLGTPGYGEAASLAASLTARGDARLRRALLVLAHPRTAPSADWLQALQRGVGAHVPLVGGVLDADLRHPDAALSCQATSLGAGAVGALLAGALQVGTGTAHGWHPIGAPRRTTLTDGCLVRTINGAPAAGLYRDYFGEAAVRQIIGETLPRMAIAYPLGISRSARAAQPVLRSVERIQEDGSLRCLGEVPQDAWVRLMIGSRQSVVEAATRAASLAISRVRQVRGALVFEAAARHRLLGRQAAEEVQALRRVLGAHVPFIGGLTQAEIVPPYHGVDAALQNETISVITIGE